MDAPRNGSRPLKWCVASLAGMIGGILVLVYLVLPLNTQRRKIEADLSARQRATDQALQAVRKLPETRQRCADLGQMLDGETNRYVLRPVLGSFPVQRDIYRLASETGFNVSLVREIGKTPTPATVATGDKRKAVPGKPAARKAETPALAPWFARYLVEVTGDGSYAVILALIDRLEQENPFCGVTALTIRGLPNTVERHRATLTLEWPVAADPPVARSKGTTR